MWFRGLNLFMLSYTNLFLGFHTRWSTKFVALWCAGLGVLLTFSSYKYQGYSVSLRNRELFGHRGTRHHRGVLINNTGMIKVRHLWIHNWFRITTRWMKELVSMAWMMTMEIDVVVYVIEAMVRWRPLCWFPIRTPSGPEVLILFRMVESLYLSDPIARDESSWPKGDGGVRYDRRYE